MINLANSEEFSLVASGAASGVSARTGKWCRALIPLADGTMTVTRAVDGASVGPFAVRAWAPVPCGCTVTASTGAYLILW